MLGMWPGFSHKTGKEEQRKLGVASGSSNALLVMGSKATAIRHVMAVGQ